MFGEEPLLLFPLLVSVKMYVLCKKSVGALKAAGCRSISKQEASLHHHKAHPIRGRKPACKKQTDDYL